jgi:NAD(P)H-hydrate epimerase
MDEYWLSRDEVRELDRRAIEEYGVPGVVLMENAGRGCAELLMRLNPDRKPVVILCGPGNNGGDGFVIARHLDNHGWPVTTWLFAPADPRPLNQLRVGTHPRLTDDAGTNWDIYSASGNPVVDVDLDAPGFPVGWERNLTDQCQAAGWVVDALFGTGLSRPLGPPFDEVVAQVNASGNPVLAVDLPSGLDCDTGEPLGPTVRATHTATFVAPKKGFRNPTSRDWTGEVHVIDIGAPRKLVGEFRALRRG